jgi:hypothetical protein
MVDEFLDRPLTESLIEMCYLGDGIAGVIEKPHGFQEEAMLLWGGVEVDFD